MAGVNQGYYKKILKRYQNVKSENENIDLEYSLDLIDDIVELWGCLERCNDLYKECNSLIIALEGLLESQKFEMEETRDNYKDIMEDIVSIKYDAISKYKTYKSAFGSQFSDSEKDSINGFDVERER